MKLMEYQTKRGGKVVFQDIAKPSSTEWGTPLQAMEAALELEKTVSWQHFKIRVEVLFLGEPKPA